MNTTLIAKLERRLKAAQSSCDKAAAARRNLGFGASRARVTTANARWASAAEERDRIARELESLKTHI